MSSHLVATERVFPSQATSAVDGRVVFEGVKSAWPFVMVVGGLAGIIIFPSGSGLTVFLLLTAVTICAGHSVGMHRLLIHRSFETPLWLEHILVYLGTVVGMAGPFGMIRAHDMRDWHQRQTVCPPHPSHNASFLKDAYWQLCCKFELDHPPEFRMESSVARDRFYRFLEKTWMWQQLPLALLLFAWGGLAWVLWGVCLRVSLSLIGHWAVGHFAHRKGQQSWVVEGLPVQGYNLPNLALITFGESFHGNHHAFPHSANLGVERGQIDLGFSFIKILGLFGLAKNIQEPRSMPLRKGLKPVEPLLNQPPIRCPVARFYNPLHKRET